MVQFNQEKLETNYFDAPMKFYKFMKPNVQPSLSDKSFSDNLKWISTTLYPYVAILKDSQLPKIFEQRNNILKTTYKDTWTKTQIAEKLLNVSILYENIPWNKTYEAPMKTTYVTIIPDINRNGGEDIILSGFLAENNIPIILCIDSKTGTLLWKNTDTLIGGTIFTILTLTKMES